MDIKAFSRLRNMRAFRIRAMSIKHLALAPEVQSALIRWLKSTSNDWTRGVLIGGLARSFYATPRYTQDIDLLFLRASDAPTAVSGFKKHRFSAFEDRLTGVEVELVSPETIAVPAAVVSKVIETAVNHEGLRVASLAGMIVLKLFSSDDPKRQRTDEGDIQHMLGSDPDIDLSDWNLSESHITRLEVIRDIVKQ